MKYLAALAAFAILTGCGAKVPSNMSGVRVAVRAEPKAGYRPELQPSGGGYASNPESDDPGRQRFPFQRLNYDSLDNIVVWLEPQELPGPAAPPPRVVTIDAGASVAALDKSLKATPVGGVVRLENRSAEPVNVYVRTEQGEVDDLGDISPGGADFVLLPAPGLRQVLREAPGGAADDVLVGQVYAAPSHWVRTAVSGGSVTFAPVPPGRYVARSWHPRLPGSERPVTLAAGRVSDVTLTVGVNALPKVP